MIERKNFKASDLRRVAKAPPPDDPPLFVGDWCEMNSGSPRLLVVDHEQEWVTVAHYSGTEARFPRAIVRRCKGTHQ